MSFLIDTCAISELVRPAPNPRVVGWFAAAPQDGLYLSVLTLGEIRNGVMGLKESQRRNKIAMWLEHELPAWFDRRLLSIDAGVADEWGRLSGQIKRDLPAIDGLIAATAIHHRLTVVTRNTKDFSSTGVEVLNPWQN